jgi:peroxiredoxin
MSTRSATRRASVPIGESGHRQAKRDHAHQSKAARKRREARRRRTKRVLYGGTGALVLVALAFGVRLISPPSSASRPVSAGAVSRVASVRLPASDGTSFSLAQLRGSKVVLYFYEGQSCGACQTQLQELQAALPQLRAEGAQVVAATMDPVGVSASVASQLHLSFPIVEDRGHVLGSAFGTYETGGHMGAVDQHSVVVLNGNGQVSWRDLAGTTMYVAPGDILSAVKAA